TREGFPRRFPDWSADSILSRDSSGKLTLYGYCLQYNVILLQALRAFGIQGRHFMIDGVNQSGHEIAEVWSNQFGKWIYLDGALDTLYLDKTNVPMSMLELHR